MMWMLADEPMHLVTGDALPGGPLPDWVIVAWTGAAIFAALLLVTVLGIRWWLAQPDADLAFDHLCGRLGLSGADRRVIEHLAAMAGVHPVALLVSRHGFARASQALIQSKSPVIAPSRIASLADKLLGNTDTW